MQTITLPAGQKNLEGLILLTAGLERLTGGGKIEIREAIVIETENMPAFWALQDMLAKDYMVKALPNHGRAGDQLIETILSKPVKALEDHSRREEEPKPGRVKTKAKEMAKRHYKPRVKTQEKAKRHYKPRAKNEPSPVFENKISKHRLDILYEIMDGPKAGAKYRGPSIALMMKAGNLAAGTHLRHPERGNLVVVTNGAGSIHTLQAVPA